MSYLSTELIRNRFFVTLMGDEFILNRDITEKIDAGDLLKMCEDLEKEIKVREEEINNVKERLEQFNKWKKKAEEIQKIKREEGRKQMEKYIKSHNESKHLNYKKEIKESQQTKE